MHHRSIRTQFTTDVDASSAIGIDTCVEKSVATVKEITTAINFADDFADAADLLL